MAGDDIWSPNSQIPRVQTRGLWLGAWALVVVFVLSPWGYHHLKSPNIVTPLTPASWAQDIWLFIIGLQSAGLVYQLVPAGYDPDGDKQRSVNTVGPRWVGTALCLLAWLAAGSASTPATAWLALVAVLVAATLQLQALNRLYGLRAKFGRAPKSLYLLYFLPTSMLTAWLTLVISCTGLAAMTVTVDTKDLDVAAVVFMAVMVGAGAFMLVHHRDTVFGLTLIWAFVGVYEAAKDRGAEHSVQYAALGSVVLVTILCLVSVLRRRQPDPAIEGDLEEQQPLRSQEL